MCSSAGRAGTQPDHTPGRRRTVCPARAVSQHDKFAPTDFPTQERHCVVALHVKWLTNGHDHGALCTCAAL